MASTQMSVLYLTYRGSAGRVTQLRDKNRLNPNMFLNHIFMGDLYAYTMHTLVNAIFGAEVGRVFIHILVHKVGGKYHRHSKYTQGAFFHTTWTAKLSATVNHDRTLAS